MPTTDFTFDISAMESFVNGACASGAGAATPAPPGAPPAAISAPGIPGENIADIALPPPPPPTPVVDAASNTTSSPGPSPAVNVDEGGFKLWHGVFGGAFCSLSSSFARCRVMMTSPRAVAKVRALTIPLVSRESE